jgi:DNA-binding XRE family transcriptional regulator
MSGDVHNIFSTAAISCLPPVLKITLLIRDFMARNNHYGMKNSIMHDKVNKAAKPLTSAQMRAARALIRWSAEDLARETALSVTTIRRAELTDDETSMTTANDLAVRRALEAAGVEFIDENGGGPGVRLRQRRRPKAPKK